MDDKVLITNWSLPCPAKEASDGSFSMLTALSNAAGGTYPIGANGLWHGGIHFDKGTANNFDQSSVKCIADGEVIAYRIDASYPTTVYPGKPPMQTTAAFSTGFVLVKHTLQAPEKPTKPESETSQASAETATATPPSITLFSLYMHLKDWKSYQVDNKLAKPSFWGEGAEYAVKSDTKDAVLGLNARAGYPGQTGHSTIYGVIPRGVIVEASEASPDGCWLKVSSTTPNVPELTGDAWVYKGEMHSLGADQYLISEEDSKDKPATEILGLNVRETEQGGKIIAVLPRASVITISGTGRYRKLESIVSGISTPALIPAVDGKLPGYVWFESLVADAKPKNTDSIVTLDTPATIKAGDLIGHIGTYQNNDGVDQQQLHVELFSCDDVPGFISKSRAWAASLADGQKTLLKIHKGASKLIAHHDGISETNPPKLTDAGTEIGVTITIPQNLLDALPATHKIKISKPATAGQPPETTYWWRLDDLLADKNGKPISGWLCEQELITTRHSPWEWEGYDYIEETGKPVEHVAYALDAMGMLDKDEQANYRTMINKVDGGPLTSTARLYEIVDSNKDDKLTSREITSALTKPWSAQALSQIITKYESEWFKNPAKWDELDDILTPEPSEPNLIWTAEKQRIEKLSWWDQLAGQQGLSADGKAWHLNPTALLGSFSSHNKGKITVPFLEKILGKPGAWFTGRGGSSRFIENFRENYPAIYNIDKYKFVKILNAALTRYEITTSYQQAHFLAQCFHESAHFETTIEFASGEGYNPGQHRDAEKNGNTTIGDGPRYKGKGLIQLTWKNNYKKYSSYRGIDFTEFPDQIASEMFNAVDVSCWYWRNNGGIHRKYNAKGDINILIEHEPNNVQLITLAVNGGSNGLAERIKIFEAIKKEWSLK
ncbi:glycoside hydrolase family 19 protein [Pseudomonas sp.]|uniref:glycoside hydrolase family 19 protein n=1 Tax=Pseudomonas sp. TaxID=306 RepID=UPI003A978B18